MLTFDTNEYVLYPKVIDILETLKENVRCIELKNKNDSLLTKASLKYDVHLPDKLNKALSFICNC